MKSLNEYIEERFNGLFLLRGDNEFADVVIMYKSSDDAMVEDMHYIKSADYTGYVKCCGKGCPACAKGIRVQTKLPIPLYNITEQELQIWDRNISFRYQLYNDIFNNYSNPSDVILRITRHGISGDINTKYEIKARGANINEQDNKPLYNIAQILRSHDTNVAGMYADFCKTYSISELTEILSSSSTNDNSNSDSSSTLPDYKITPRSTSTSNDDFTDIPDEDEDDAVF